jgi:hypothetical protein
MMAPPIQRQTGSTLPDQSARETGCDTMTAALNLRAAAIVQRTQI